MQLRATLALALGLAAAPIVGVAHPHVFVDTQLRVVVGNDGTFQGVEVSWTYDDFYSLLLLSDYGLDNDGDGALDPNELARLDGFDLQWIDGFEGDSYATRNGTPVKLGAPEGRGVEVTNGQITSTHFRPASAPADGVVIKAFDPTFYTAYTLVGEVQIDGPCRATQIPADLDAAYTLVEELLYVTPSSDLEEGYPEVGEAFADTVTLSCAG
ncbi:DUF1007 family protein [Tateyamaria sp. SN3-11]|uniref:DUF1007 family protein n=1 Tax=Tateyamaria sp. SN3-11 TaxID=3092147 RepID=UPI0039E81AB2